MFWIVLIARVLVGLPFLVFGVIYFLPVEMPKPDVPANASTFAGVLFASGYMNVVKALEVVGGALVLSGRFVPLGLVLVTPVAVNIALWDLLLVGTPALGVVLTGLCAFLIWAYRSHFAPVFAMRPKIG